MTTVNMSNFQINSDGAPGEPLSSEEIYENGVYMFFQTLTDQRTEMNRDAELVLDETQAHHDTQATESKEHRTDNT